MMKKLFCILGETSRGKDTFARILENDYGLRQVVLYLKSNSMILEILVRMR